MTSLALLRARIRRARPCYLYRVFGEEGELLYVGVAYSVGRRLAEHQDAAAWWPRATRVELEVHEDRGSALAAETIAIKTEHPIYNIANKTRPELKDLYERNVRR